MNEWLNENLYIVHQKLSQAKNYQRTLIPKKDKQPQPTYAFLKVQLYIAVKCKKEKDHACTCVGMQGGKTGTLSGSVSNDSVAQTSTHHLWQWQFWQLRPAPWHRLLSSLPGSGGGSACMHRHQEKRMLLYHGQEKIQVHAELVESLTPTWKTDWIPPSGIEEFVEKKEKKKYLQGLDLTIKNVRFCCKTEAKAKRWVGFDQQEWRILLLRKKKGLDLTIWNGEFCWKKNDEKKE